MNLGGIPRLRTCRLCGSPSDSFQAGGMKTPRTYWRCRACGFVFLDPLHIPDRAAARRRYLLHQNDESSPGYREYMENFARRCIAAFADPRLPVLDFGSGPGPKPILPSILAGLGYECEAYDPLFAPGPTWRKRKYGCLALHEVAEHFSRPRRSFAAAARRLGPGGVLAVRTRFIPSDANAFGSWWYKEDPTHLSFYNPEALETFLHSLGFRAEARPDRDMMVFRLP